MITIGICDDDKKDLQRVTVLLHHIMKRHKKEYRIISFLSAKEMLASRENFEIGILDIAMEELLGIELGKRLKHKFSQMQVIYVTSFEEYCIEAINEVHAYSYLSKPIEETKMEKQITELVSHLDQNYIEKEFCGVTDEQGKEYSSLMINLEEVLYFEYMKKTRKVRIVLEKQTYEYSCVMKQLTEEMENYKFAVNCRGYLVNLIHVAKVKGYVVYLDNGCELPVSQKRIAEFRERLNQYLQYS